MRHAGRLLLLGLLTTLLLVVGQLAGGTPSAMATWLPAAVTTPGPGAMTVYTVTNPNTSPVSVKHSFVDKNGATVYSFTASVAAQTSTDYHVRDYAQVPSPFSGSVTLSGNLPFTAQVTGYDYPAASPTPTNTATSTPTPTKTSTPPPASTATSTPTKTNTPPARTSTPTATATSGSGGKPGDLAFGRPVVASSTASGSSPANGVDGSASTYWISSGTGEQWIYVDLGQSVALQTISVAWNPAAYATYYYLETCNDAVSWSPFWTVTAGSGAETISTNRTARYVRIRATTAKSGATNYQLASLEVYGSATPTPTGIVASTSTPTPTNTRTPTATGTVAPSRTPTLSPTPSPRPTNTATPTRTFTPTPRPTASSTSTSTPAVVVGQYQAEYFNGLGFATQPVISQIEAAPLSHDWGTGSPGAGVNADNFSARWTGTFDFGTGGYYAFSVTADDGVRLYVDGSLIIDQWKTQSPTTYGATLNLASGTHVVRIEYFEGTGGAVAKASWGKGCAVGQYLGEYFANKTLAAPAALSRCEAAPISYDWGSGSPTSGVPVDGFSARWSGTFAFTAKTYTFTARTDDGVRVWVDGVLIIDRWINQSPTQVSAVRTMTAGNHTVKVEYYENAGGAVAQISWQ